jgi:virulence-associated protein VagC
LLASDYWAILKTEPNAEMKVMRAKITRRGLIIPKEMLADAEEVEIRKEDHRIVIFPVASDPIQNLGKHPVECGVPDASEHHDSYLYGSGT